MLFLIALFYGHSVGFRRNIHRFLFVRLYDHCISLSCSSLFLILRCISPILEPASFCVLLCNLSDAVCKNTFVVWEKAQLSSEAKFFAEGNNCIFVCFFSSYNTEKCLKYDHVAIFSCSVLSGVSRDVTLNV